MSQTITVTDAIRDARPSPRARRCAAVDLTHETKERAWRSRI